MNKIRTTHKINKIKIMRKNKKDKPKMLNLNNK